MTLARTTAPWVRVVIVLSGAAVVFGLSYYFTGSWLPTEKLDALVFQNALLLIVFGSALLEHHFTKPADSLVNSLMGMLTLVTVYSAAPAIWWWIVFSYCGGVFLLATICTSVSSGADVGGWRATLAGITYRPAVELGAARRLFSLVFLFGVFAFYGVQSQRTATLVFFWGLFVVIWPLGLPQLLSGLVRTRSKITSLGEVVRSEWPNLVRVALKPESSWVRETLRIYSQADGTCRWVLPLYSHLQGQQLLGTGLCLEPLPGAVPNLVAGAVYDPADLGVVELPVISELLGGEEISKLVGFVVEESGISSIRFELWDPTACSDGMLVWCGIGDDKVFYQVTDGYTKEESLESDRHGFQVAVATQLGVIDDQHGFKQYEWLPAMNTPVFAEAAGFGVDLKTTNEEDFVFGHVPKSKIKVGGPFRGSLDHHTAILGVTGSGKTELAFDLIRDTLSRGTKVICIDLTGQYRDRLTDLKGGDLSISEDLAKELGDKLFDVETGTYGAGDQKKALGEFSSQLRDEISKSIESFLDPAGESMLGIIELNEISNTKATLYVTELYLTCLLRYARENTAAFPGVLIVVEEAHTVMPEPATMGLGDFDSKGLVGKIAQIALQGRKYGVGLLVLAQRTATVSKTVLTQCNTIISFASYDDTSLKFLKNVLGEDHIKLIPNLPPLHAVVFGRGVRSQRPIVVEIPFDPTKAAPQGVLE